eukprot:gene3385-3317_t
MATGGATGTESDKVAERRKRQFEEFLAVEKMYAQMAIDNGGKMLRELQALKKTGLAFLKEKHMDEWIQARADCQRHQRGRHGETQLKEEDPSLRPDQRTQDLTPQRAGASPPPEQNEQQERQHHHEQQQAQPPTPPQTATEGNHSITTTRRVHFASLPCDERYEYNPYDDGPWDIGPDNPGSSSPPMSASE